MREVNWEYETLFGIFGDMDKLERQVLKNNEFDSVEWKVLSSVNELLLEFNDFRETP